MMNIICCNGCFITYNTHIRTSKNDKIEHKMNIMKHNIHFIGYNIRNISCNTHIIEYNHHNIT